MDSSVVVTFAARFARELVLLTLLVAVALTVGVAYSFALGTVGPWTAAFLIAVACAFGRKVERELRFNTLYPSQPWLRHGLLAVGWLMRPYDPNPWVRIELRALGLGNSKLRLTVARLAERFVVVYGPPTWLYLGAASWSVMLFSRASADTLTAGMEQMLPLAQLVAVVWLLPSLLLMLHSAATRGFRVLDERYALATMLVNALPSPERLHSTVRRVRESFPGLRA